MPFKYSCFISYSGSKNRILEGFVTGFGESLSREVALYCDVPVFWDRQRLESGEPWAGGRKLAAAICQSVCMVPILTPLYFRSTYCMKEYVAMKMLEQRRRPALPGGGNTGLIIPIVLRGTGLLPPEITKHRQYFDFSNFLLSDTEIDKNPVYHVNIQKIAAYVSKLYESFKSLPDDPSEHCSEFELPKESQLDEWLDGVNPDAGPSFPSFGAGV
jgi:hypothetical protein